MPLMKPIVLVITDYYLPGFKAGGPIRSLSNMIGYLDCWYEFKIITRDRDINEKTSYNNIRLNSWNIVGKADVYYLTPEKMRLTALYRLLNETKYDVLYLYSIFSPFVALMPLLLRRIALIPFKPVIIASRGELSKGALSIKSFKKRFFIFCAKLIGLYKNVRWHASSKYEEVDIHRVFGNKKISLCSNIVKIFS